MVVLFDSILLVTYSFIIKPIGNIDDVHGARSFNFIEMYYDIINKTIFHPIGIYTYVDKLYKNSVNYLLL